MCVCREREREIERERESEWERDKNTEGERGSGCYGSLVRVGGNYMVCPSTSSQPHARKSLHGHLTSTIGLESHIKESNANRDWPLTEGLGSQPPLIGIPEATYVTQEALRSSTPPLYSHCPHTHMSMHTYTHTHTDTDTDTHTHTHTHAHAHTHTQHTHTLILSFSLSLFLSLLFPTCIDPLKKPPNKTVSTKIMQNKQTVFFCFDLGPQDSS